MHIACAASLAAGVVFFVTDNISVGSSMVALAVVFLVVAGRRDNAGK